MAAAGKNVRAAGRASISVIALMFLALTAVLAVWLYSSYQNAAKGGVDRVVAASKIVAANANWLTSLARETLHRIDESLGPEMMTSGPRSVHDLNLAVADLPGNVTAFVIGADGKTLFSNDRDMKPIDVADRDYFTRLANGAPEYTSALMISRFSGRQVFVFSRRLERKNVFAGVAVISFDANILRQVWDAVALGKNSTVSLIRRDGELVARHPEPGGPVDMANHVLFNDYMRKWTSGTYVSQSPVDSQVRLVAYRIVERTPFVAIASAELAGTLQPFWNDAKVAGLLVLFAFCGALAAAWWILSLMRAEARNMQRLADALHTNQVLMREIHHRVKNNLQTVMALVRMQNFEPEAVQKLNDRIMAMSAVHEQMYGFDEFTGVSARALIPSLVKTLVDVHERPITLTFEIDDLIVHPDKATPLALMLNELLANIMKYAFKDRDGGNVWIELRKISPTTARLVVADDGIGLENAGMRSGMGTRLIAAFVNQMRGTYEYMGTRGTRFVAVLELMGENAEATS
ncbi:histidine kinase dimerization/phosphoacceptor domain -containing protein [Rhizobium sp. S152]|uniref:sensor histidine kinase n=1 Tax=Rhizobium sp. S152 TaxID=3055038 RepID=UPI0025AA0C8A|nr:histidine kinase dimerization/phosphoacceptor domain -containing protein [Rhizobium sp. S152]MDM9625556.1 histidine kinase dimerization/phosphoacceptor domain -containing protein [Rhizobium sp. S152]